MHHNFNQKRNILDVPTHCPRCGNKLDLDVNLENTLLLCSNNDCGYKLDATKEFEEASKAHDEEFEKEFFEEHNGTPYGDDDYRNVYFEEE